MRIPFAAALAASFIAGAITAASVTVADSRSDHAGFLAELDEMQLASFEERSADTVLVIGATWNEAKRNLLVKAKTLHEKGTLVTLMGLPASTWVDASRISSDYAANFELRVLDGQAVPCKVAISSAFAEKIVPVDNAPDACGNLLAIKGFVTTGSGLPLTSGRVIVTVGDNAFTTNTVTAGNYALEVYSESDDAPVTIAVEGRVGAERQEWRIYEGNIGGLKAGDGAKTYVWATELFGRDVGRLLFARR